MMKRRQFLFHASALAGTAALSQLGSIAARATTADDYKALVCVFLIGGNDSNNMVVPIDTTGYANYAKVRGDLALAQSSLLPMQEAGGVLRYGLHGGLPHLQSLWSTGKLAVVANVGNLVQPLTKAQYLSVSAPKPEALFSHIDQQHEIQASIASTASNTGWGGRLSDEFAALNANASVPSMISTSGNNLFLTGTASQALVVPVSGSFGLNGYSTNAADAARRSALMNLLGIDQSAELLAAAQGVMKGALGSSAVLNPILNSNSTAAASHFSGLTTNIAMQLRAIAKVIEARATLGAKRQVFLAILGSFDTHTDQLNRQKQLFAQLDPALFAFHSAMADIGAGSEVTSFTLSDFSRTYQPNTGGGSDHAWGSHHLVIGDAVKGGALYGTMPELALGSPDDEGDEGRWIPTIATDQYAATLSSWFGANANTLANVLPNLSAFSRPPAFV